MKLDVKRMEYTKKTLELEDLGNNPLIALQLWLSQAYAENIIEANAATLATSGAGNRPTSRTILVKEIDDEGLIFYTNLESKKAKDMKENPFASLTFYWRELEKQISLEGKIKAVSRKAAADYFKTRPRESQLAAWASMQGAPLNSRDELIAAFQKEKKRWEGLEIQLPKHWGGFKLIVDTALFWQGRLNRLHDRFLFTKKNKRWKAVRISP